MAAITGLLSELQRTYGNNLAKYKEAVGVGGMCAICGEDFEVIEVDDNIGYRCYRSAMGRFHALRRGGVIKPPAWHKWEELLPKTEVNALGEVSL